MNTDKTPVTQSGLLVGYFLKDEFLPLAISGSLCGHRVSFNLIGNLFWEIMFRIYNVNVMIYIIVLHYIFYYH